MGPANAKKTYVKKKKNLIKEKTKKRRNGRSRKTRRKKPVQDEEKLRINVGSDLGPQIKFQCQHSVCEALHVSK